MLNGIVEPTELWHPRQVNTIAFAKPKPALDCHECGRAKTMKLQQSLGSQPNAVQLLYVCYACGTTLKIPPTLPQP